jgi:type I restriction enzyme S subunit
MVFKKEALSNIISEVIDYRGKTPKKLGGEWSNNGYRAFSAKNIKTGKIVQPETIRFVNNEVYVKWMKTEVERGTIIITSEAPFGEIFYWDSDEKIVLSQRLFGLKIKSEFNPKYIYYFMIGSEFQRELSSRATGSTVTGLRQPQLLSCSISYPSYESQNKIAKILSSIDRKIEINNGINENLQKLSQELYKRWFVDFEFPDKNGNPYKTSGGKMIESELVEIPEGWEIKRISDLTNVFTGKKNANENSVTGKYKFFTCSPNNLMSDTYIFDGPAVIIAGNGAYTGRTRFYDGKFELYQRTYACTIKKEIDKSNIYGLYIMMKLIVEPSYMGGTHGSAIPYIVMSDIADYKFGYNNKIFLNFSRIIEKNIKQISNNEKQNELLTQLRDILLIKLMNGEIDLNKIEV